MPSKPVADHISPAEFALIGEIKRVGEVGPCTKGHVHKIAFADSVRARGFGDYTPSEVVWTWVRNEQCADSDEYRYWMNHRQPPGRGIYAITVAQRDHVYPDYHRNSWTLATKPKP